MWAETCVNHINFVRIVQGIHPLEAMILVKLKFSIVLGAINQHIKVKFGWKEQTYGPLLPAKFHHDRSPLKGEKPKNRPMIQYREVGALRPVVSVTMHTVHNISPTNTKLSAFISTFQYRCNVSLVCS